MKIGILGVGHLAAAMLTGFRQAGLPVGDFLLSPRGQAFEQASQHGFGIARDNHDLVEQCQIVILAVRPQDACRAVEGLAWQPHHLLISVCAGVSLSELGVQPARVMRAMPLTAASINASPTACFPAFPQALTLLEKIGPVICLDEEEAFEIATVNAAVYGFAQDLIRITANWSTEQMVKSSSNSSNAKNLATMRHLVSLTFAAAGHLIDKGQEPMEAMLTSLVTPGGITELGLDRLAHHDYEKIWREACNAVLMRLSR